MIPQFLKTGIIHLKATSHEASIHLGIHSLFNFIFFSPFYSFRKLSNLPNAPSLIILQPFKSWLWETDILNQFTVLTALWIGSIFSEINLAQCYKMVCALLYNEIGICSKIINKICMNTHISLCEDIDDRKPMMVEKILNTSNSSFI